MIDDVKTFELIDEVELEVNLCQTTRVITMGF